MSTHHMELDELYYRQIKEESKTHEVRLFDDKRKQLKIGDIIVFENKCGNGKCAKTITSLKWFPDFESAIRETGLQKVMPSEKSYDSCIEKYRAFGDGKYGQMENKLGVLVIGWN